MRTNADKLPMMAVAGHPRPPMSSDWQVSHQGEPFCTFRTGGITYNVKVGDSVYDWAGDHIEPGVSCQAGDGGRDEPNRALNVLSCIGNSVRVASGDAKGAEGTVTGKHGGAENIIVDFPADVLDQLTYEDKLIARARGQGLKLLDYPTVACYNLAPELLAVMGIEESEGKLRVPVSAIVPGGMMGSGIGSSSPFRGDYDIQTSEPSLLDQHGLRELRLGDIVAIVDHHATHGWSLKNGGIIIGVVIHADSFKAGHGPGVANLLTCIDGSIVPVIAPKANIADYLSIGRCRS